MSSTLIEQLRTQEDVDVLLGEIDTLLDGLYESNWEQILQKSVRASTANWIREQSADLRPALEELKTAVHKLKVVNLTIAFAPTQKIIDSVSTWIKNEVGPAVVLALQVDPEIIAGARVSFAGHYGDYTLKHRLDDYHG